MATTKNYFEKQFYDRELARSMRRKRFIKRMEAKLAFKESLYKEPRQPTVQ